MTAIPKQFQAQIIIGTVVKVGPLDDAWMVQQKIGDYLARILSGVPEQIEITSVSSSFIPRAPNPMDFMQLPDRVEPQPEGQRGNSVAGSISPPSTPS